MYKALAPSGLLLPHGVEAHLSRAGAADRHPVPVEDEGFVPLALLVLYYACWPIANFRERTRAKFAEPRF